VSIFSVVNLPDAIVSNLVKNYYCYNNLAASPLTKSFRIYVLELFALSIFTPFNEIQKTTQEPLKRIFNLQ